MSSAQAAVAALKNIVRPAYHGWQSLYHGWQSLYHGWQSLVVRRRGKRNLAAVKRDLEQRAPGLILEVSETDEMFRYGVYLEGSAEGSLARYYREGETLCNDLSGALERNGLTLEGARSVLDFACGYGRVTRWLVIRCGADRLAASDIDPKAVAFVRRTFSVSAFASTADAREFQHEFAYPVIFVASLFSHLALDNWRPWLAKLVSMLTPNGLLVLSTHSMAEYEQLLPTQTVAFHASEPGFVYGGGNETEGRLDGTYYGTAFVTEDFVRREVAVAGGEVTEFTRQGLAQHQDLYVVRKHHDRIASAR